MREFTAVSLFCGAGGLDMGFERAGYKTVWANDSDEDACKTHQNWSKANVVCGDISKIDYSTIPISDVMLGGFPCQGFSLSGPRKIDDTRNVLYKHYVKLVCQNKPKVFIAENVKGILTMGDGQVIDAIIEDFARCGYDVYYKLLNAKNFGVPQDRERVIIIGFRNDLAVKNFELPDSNGKKMTLRQAIGNMEEAKPNEVCDAAYSSRYMSRNRKRDWDDVAYTVPAMAKQVTLWPGSPDMVKIDKDLWAFGENGMTRRLSWREVAAIQTFPPSIEFYGDLVSVYKQIGNAVPVALAEFVANYIRPYLEMTSQ
ncbi:MAG: DNA cytosine methyltransferase [Ruminococcaceae bacterium]|nr:DNA cytosine methyltransferase [Oscillospiraceae bacterium]